MIIVLRQNIHYPKIKITSKISYSSLNPVNNFLNVARKFVQKPLLLRIECQNR